MIKQSRSWIRSTIEQTIRLAKKFSLPGFGRVPIYYVIVFLFKELKKQSINVRASALAFNFFFSTIPGRYINVFAYSLHTGRQFSS